jgi:hypothetical protein
MREDARQRATEFVKELYAAGEIDADRLDTGVAGVLAARSEVPPSPDRTGGSTESANATQRRWWSSRSQRPRSATRSPGHVTSARALTQHLARVRVLGGDWKRSQCRAMMNFTDLAPVSSDRLVPVLFPDRSRRLRC